MVDQDDSSWELLLAIADTKDGPRVVRGIGIIFSIHDPLRHVLGSTWGSPTHLRRVNTTPQAGFATLYRFFSWPDAKRLRVSQVCVLPPFQKNGTGAQLLAAAAEHARITGAVDVTVGCCD